MGNRPHQIRATNLPTLDVSRVHDAIRVLGYERQDERTAKFLSEIHIDGRMFKFVANERGFNKLRILCPSCGHKVIKLVLLEAEFRCRACHKLRVPSRCVPREILPARYYRPWLMLESLQRKLELAKTPRQRAIALNRIRKLRSAMPDYIVGVYDDGAAPISLIAPPYSEALTDAL